MQVYTNDFAVDLRIFDATNKYHSHSVEIGIKNKNFGVDVIQPNNRRIPFVQQIEEGGIAHGLSLNIALGNINHKQSDLPPD